MTNHAFGAMALRLIIGSKHNAQTVLAMAVTRSCTRDIVVAERWFNPSSPHTSAPAIAIEQQRDKPSPKPK